MYYKEERDLIEALTLIKSVCEKSRDCKDCPMYSYAKRDCSINCCEPECWDVVSYDEIKSVVR